MGSQPPAEARQRPTDALVAGRYRLTSRVARGGMGEVYAAVDESTGRPVALKRILREVLASPVASASLMREYQLLAELRHPCIVDVYDYGVDAGLPYYTMELLDGQDLRDLAPLPPSAACAYLRDVASSLALLHTRRLVHRDLSPRNVRLTGGGRCKLIDFGTVVAFGIPPNIAGTAPLVAPEALRGAALDPRSDLYSLGALAYYLLTGEHGYSVRDFDELRNAHRKPLVRPSKLAPEVPQALDDLVMALMATDPMQRPRTAAEGIVLLSAIGGLSPDVTPGVAQSFLTSAHLIGRDDERRHVERHIDRALSGHGSTLLIAGASGTGRTRLLTEAVHIAQARGFAAVQVVARGQRGTEALTAQLLQALKRNAPEETAAAFGARTSISPALEASPWNASRAPTGEARARAQTALTRLFSEVAQRRPLLLAIDDIELADDFSAAFIAALAHEARHFALVIVATLSTDHSESAFSALASLRQDASALALAALDRSAAAKLVESLFGDVPNVDRASEWLYRVAHGNPALTLELAEHLIARHVVRFAEGMWVLPGDAIHEVVPAGLTQTLSLRLLRLGPAARALAELMSVRRGGLSLDLAAKASESSLAELVAAFDELAREGIIEVAGDEYVFAQQAMREAARSSFASERASELHGRLARGLLADARAPDDARIEAGWHLVHTPDELRGADLLAELGPRLVQDGLNIATAIPAIEKALAVYELRGRPLADRLRLRSLLVLAGYLFDYRLGLRHGPATFAALYECSALALTARLRRYLSGPLAFLCAQVVMNVMRLFVRKRDRSPNPVAALQYFGRTAMGLMGLRATALDGPGTAAILPHVSAFGVIPPPFAARPVALAAKAFALQPLGREAELHDAVSAALHSLVGRRPLLMRESERQDLLTGLLLIDGINEAYREQSQALERASRLDALGSQLAAACARRVRMTYHTVRGAREAAEAERKQLDLLAIQGGTTWQVEWFSVPIEGLAGALLGDLIAARRSLEKLDALLAYVPSLEPLRDAVRIGYHYRRGEHERVATLGEAFVVNHPPRTVVGWGPTYALIVLSMAQSGQASRALEIVEYALSTLTEGDHAYFIMYAPLLAGQAWSYAILGQLERAETILRACEARLTVAGEHAGLAFLSDQRARLARRLGDREKLRMAVADMRRASLAAGNASLLAMAEQWADVYARASSAPPPASPPPPRDTPARDASSSAVTMVDNTSSDRTAVTTFLMDAHGPARHRRALQMIASAVGSADAFFYTCSGRSLTLAATLEDAEPPESLEGRIAELLSRHPAPGQHVIELDEVRERFQVIVLAATNDRDHDAVVAMREGADPPRPLRASMLEEIAFVLGAGSDEAAVG